MTLGNLRNAVLVPVLAGLLSACAEPASTEPIGAVAGTYKATTYAAGPSESDRTDLLALGVTWTLLIKQDGVAASTMGANNPTTPKHDEAQDGIGKGGMVYREGSTLTFVGFEPQRMLTQRTWTVEGDQIVAVNQTVDGVSATIRFTRQ